MKIGIDLDSVLADLMIPLNEFHNQRFGTSLNVEDYVEFRLSDFWGCTIEEVFDRVYEFYESDYMDNIPLIPGASDAVDYLNKNHELVVITSRPTITKESTLKWIDTHFPNKFSQVVLSNQFSRENNKSKTKGEIGLELKIEAMIDDNVEYAQECLSMGIQSYLFDATWNKNKTVSKEIVRLHDWSEIQKYF